MAGQYADITFTDQRHFTTALHRVVAALTDPELPVRVDSVVALRTFVEACKGLFPLEHSVSVAGITVMFSQGYVIFSDSIAMSITSSY